MIPLVLVDRIIMSRIEIVVVELMKVVIIDEI